MPAMRGLAGASSLSPAPTASMELDLPSSPVLVPKSSSSDEPTRQEQPSPVSGGTTDLVKEEEVDHLREDTIDLKMERSDTAQSAATASSTNSMISRNSSAQRRPSLALPTSQPSLSPVEARYRRESSSGVSTKRKRSSSPGSDSDTPLAASSARPRQAVQQQHRRATDPFNASGPSSSTNLPPRSNPQKQNSAPFLALPMKMGIPTARASSLEDGEIVSDKEARQNTDTGGFEDIQTTRLRVGKMFERGADQMYRCRICR